MPGTGLINSYIFNSKYVQRDDKDTVVRQISQDCYYQLHIYESPHSPKYVPRPCRQWTSRKWFGPEGVALMNGISALWKETPERSFAPCIVWKHSEKIAIYELGGGLSPDTTSAVSLILDFPVSRAMGNKVLLFISYPICGFPSKQFTWAKTVTHAVSSASRILRQFSP